MYNTRFFIKYKSTFKLGWGLAILNDKLPTFLGNIRSFHLYVNFKPINLDWGVLFLIQSYELTKFEQTEKVLFCWSKLARFYLGAHS